MLKPNFQMVASLLLFVLAFAGCNGGGPAPAPTTPTVAPAAGTPTGSAPGAGGQQAIANGSTSGNAPAGSAGSPSGATTGTQVDPEIQNKLLAVGAKFQQDSGAGELTRNDMKQIGLAFHNYADANQSFPALNGAGDQGSPHPGLSWRVMLLPYLDQNALYEEFHRDEPWDSEHNKTLIAKMPKVFGNSPEGKTRVHVITGKGAPFQNDQGPKFRDITDGTSNTILAFVGGPDSAEIWTKPTGREFNVEQPLQCLGNVGATFLVAMMDGSVRTVPKNIDPQQFARLAQHQDGQVVGDLSTNPSAPGSQQMMVKVNVPTTPIGPAAQKIDQSFIPADAFLALSVQPRRIYSHPIVTKLREMVPANSQSGLAGGLPWGGRGGVGEVDALRTEFGIAPENIDQFVLLLDKGFPEALANNPFGVPPFGVILRNGAPLDIDGMIAKLQSNPAGASVAQHEGVAMILGPQPEYGHRGQLMVPPPPVAPPFAPVPKTPAPNDDPCQAGSDESTDPTPQVEGAAPAPTPDRYAVAFINRSVLLFGSDSVVRKMISARATTVSTGLTSKLDALGNPAVCLAVDAAPLEKTLKTLVKQAPPQVALFSPYLIGIREIGLTCDLDAKQLLNLGVKFKTPELAQGVFGLLNAQYQGLKEQYPAGREFLTQDPASAPVLPYVDQIVGETSFTNAGDSISFTIPQLKDLDKLPDALRPAVEKAQQAATETARMNDLKQIGLAFHNFHDTFRHFPAMNGMGDKNLPSPGLSWRVYLLPYLEQVNLYQKFKLDEPWDSPHNKALIKAMPKIFGTNSEGKTSIHVFTGKGAPFQPDVGPGFRELTDGSSNTILAIAAGDDVAEIWTKPGGLPFELEDPLKCLGTIKEFRALFFDGSVRRLKNLDPETFSRLVQHADGISVAIPD